MASQLTPAITIHLASAAPALIIGAWQLFAHKGTFTHKTIGYIWCLCMYLTAISSFWIKGINNQHFSPIHILSLITIFSVTAAIVAIKRKNISSHKRFVHGAYFGLCIAFIFTFLPGRLMNTWFIQ